MCLLPALAGPGASNVISDSVSMSGTLRALTKKHFEHMRDRVTEVELPKHRVAHRCQFRALFHDSRAQSFTPLFALECSDTGLKSVTYEAVQNGAPLQVLFMVCALTFIATHIELLMCR
jgi:hypothetical protein